MVSKQKQSELLVLAAFMPVPASEVAVYMYVCPDIDIYSDQLINQFKQTFVQKSHSHNYVFN